MSVPLATLLEGIPSAELVRGDSLVEISSIQHDSRLVDVGDLFVAIPGYNADGHTFLLNAIDAGAVALVVQRDARSFWAHLPGTYPIVVVDNTRLCLASLAANFFDNPSKDLTVIGVTGTDGKTTTTHLLTKIFEQAGYTVGRLGTVDSYITNVDLGNFSSTRLTTPEATQVQEFLRKMVNAGCSYAIIESSSHGLSLNRLDDLAFDTAVLTNVSGDHLDFHKTFEAYREAKGKLFQKLEASPEPIAVVNAVDPSAHFFLDLASAARSISYAVGIEVSEEVDISAKIKELRPDGSTFQIAFPEKDVECSIQIPASFNVENALAAAATAYAHGIGIDEIVAGLAACSGIPGRMEYINAGQDFDVVVDYAHTGDAVRKVLSVLRDVTKGKLIVVAGAAGERDPGRRFGVARAAAEIADFAIFTNEDPRSENPEQIVREIGNHAEGAGKTRGKDFLEISDRRFAIARAMEYAEADDLVVVCGKGHEHSIELDNQFFPWDDREVVKEEIARLAKKHEDPS